MPTFKLHARNDFIVKKYGDPVNAWGYKNKDGKTWCIVCRHEKDGKKDLVPYSYCIDNKWHAGNPIKKNRPLFNIEKLQNNDLSVLVVEGEKCASVSVEGYIVVSWIGGCAQVELSDWSILKDRKSITIWPDNDEPGLRAAKYIQSLLPQAEVLNIDNPIKGWDIADAISEKINPIEFINNCPRLKIELSLPECDITNSSYPLHKINEFNDAEFTDLGNTKRFLKLFYDRISYIKEEKQFRVWNGKYWEEDSQKAMVSFHVEQTIKKIYEEAGLSDDMNLRKQISKWAIKSESRTRRLAIINDLEQSIHIVKSISQFDQNPWLFNCQNGTINLQTGKLQPHNLNDYNIKISPVNYDSAAICPLWDGMLQIIFKGDNDLIDYVQRLVGYSMSGISNERIIMFCWGNGRNGKSTFLEMIFYILANYARTTSIDTFMVGSKRNPGGPSEDLARLHGIRLVKTSEATDGARLNESLIKDLSGGDTITARNLRASSFDFKPILKLWMFGNYQPQIHGQDTGIKDRIKMIPFLYKIENPDKSMQIKLQAEAPAILNWMIEGCLKWQKEGLTEPDIVKNTTEKYFMENDPVGKFIQECCVLGPTKSILLKDLFKAFEEFPDSGRMQRKKFVQILERNFGLSTDKGYGNYLYTNGISLADEENPEIPF